MSFSSPVVLDLFCGGGGAARGYRKAGFEVIGIDNEDHSASYGYAGKFRRMDWQQGLETFGDDVDFIHASPPCQLFSRLTKWGRRDRVDSHPNLIPPVREALIRHGKPYIIENVESAPLINPVRLCGWMFGYEIYRHRLFESSYGIQLVAPPHARHLIKASNPGHFVPGRFASVGGHCGPMALVREVMDIGPMMPRDEIAECIPPYFTEYLGFQVRASLLATGARKPGPAATSYIWSHLP